MTSEMEPVGLIVDGVLSRLVSRYRDLSDTCYRVGVQRHGERGRFRRGHRARTPHPALVKKMDLDRHLARIYWKFFGCGDSAADAISTSTSNSLPQGSTTSTALESAAPSGSN